MYLTNFHGVAEFKVIGINADCYCLQEKKSGEKIFTPHDSLAELKNVHRDEKKLILPDQYITLFCKWKNKRWEVHPLRPGQGLSPETLVETQELECKSQGIWTFEEDVCAMANSDTGGCVYWGIDDSGEPTDGVKNLLTKYGNEDKLTTYLRNRLKQNTNTLLFMAIKFDFLWKKGMPILKISVPSSGDNIVLFKDALYVRSANTTQRLSGDRMLSYIYSKYSNRTA